MNFKNKFNRILAVMLIVAVTVFTVGCSVTDTTGPGANNDTVVDSVVTFKDGDVIGEGEKEFTLVITDKGGAEINVTVNTDAATVGEALLALDVIAGEAGDYGLYVKTVNGVTADYDVDGTYWAFYINGEYAMTGIDSTDIEQGATYSLKAEK